MSNSSTLDLPSIYDYLLENSLREDELLFELRKVTAEDPMARMQIAPEQGQFMALLVNLLSAKRIIEVGTFTGYSALCMARALPEDGELICCDVSTAWTTIAKDFWQRAKVDHKIQLHIAPANKTLENLIQTGRSGQFDMAFIDADKENYDQYYEQCLQLLRPNGLILLDNMLWSGRVADNQFQDEDTVALRALNCKVRDDERVEISLLPVADGITLARKR